MKRKTAEDLERYDVTETECVVCGCELHTAGDDKHREVCELPTMPDHENPKRGTERADICEDCFTEFLENIGQHEDEVTETPHPLNAWQWSYLDRIIKHTKREPVPLWVKEHGAEYDVPEELENHDRLTDQSWHNDMWPSFHVNDFTPKQEYAVCVWVLSPVEAVRRARIEAELGEHSAPRFIVSTLDNMDGAERCDDFETDEIKAALAEALRRADDLAARHPESVGPETPRTTPPPTPRTEEPKPEKANPRFVWNIGSIGEVFPDMLEIGEQWEPYLVLWDRQEKTPAALVPQRYANALCLETTDSQPFTDLENFYNGAGNQALTSEGISETVAPFDVCTQNEQAEYIKA